MQLPARVSQLCVRCDHKPVTHSLGAGNAFLRRSQAEDLPDQVQSKCAVSQGDCGVVIMCGCSQYRYHDATRVDVLSVTSQYLGLSVKDAPFGELRCSTDASSIGHGTDVP